MEHKASNRNVKWKRDNSTQKALDWQLHSCNWVFFSAKSSVSTKLNSSKFQRLECSPKNETKFVIALGFSVTKSRIFQNLISNERKSERQRRRRFKFVTWFMNAADVRCQNTFKSSKSWSNTMWMKCSHMSVKRNHFAFDASSKYDKTETLIKTTRLTVFMWAHSTTSLLIAWQTTKRKSIKRHQTLTLFNWNIFDARQMTYSSQCFFG